MTDLQTTVYRMLLDDRWLSTQGCMAQAKGLVARGLAAWVTPERKWIRLIGCTCGPHVYDNPGCAVHGEVPQPDIEPPSKGGIFLNGWLYNVYNQAVFRAWTGFVFHGTGHHHREDGRYPKNARQHSRALYSSFELARAALRAEVERDHARNLAAIDDMTEDDI